MYSESVAMTGYAEDASFTFDVRIARFPETGGASLWFYVFSDGVQYALVDESVTSMGGAPRVDVNAFQSGFQSIPAANVIVLADYFRQ